jgi:hypothetical protein
MQPVDNNHDHILARHGHLQRERFKARKKPIVTAKRILRQLAGASG